MASIFLPRLFSARKLAFFILSHPQCFSFLRVNFSFFCYGYIVNRWYTTVAQNKSGTKFCDKSNIHSSRGPFCTTLLIHLPRWWQGSNVIIVLTPSGNRCLYLSKKNFLLLSVRVRVAQGRFIVTMSLKRHKYRHTENKLVDLSQNCHTEDMNDSTSCYYCTNVF